MIKYTDAVAEVEDLYKVIQARAPFAEHSTAYLAGALHALLVNMIQNHPGNLEAIHRHKAVFARNR